jgi:hypothetical protein
MQFFYELPQDTREYVQEVVIEDKHGYLAREDCMMDSNAQMTGMDGFLDLDRVYEIIGDPAMFDQFMAIIQSNTARGVIWSETVQEVYGLVASKGIWNQIAPLLQQVYAKSGKKKNETIQYLVLTTGLKKTLNNIIHMKTMFKRTFWIMADSNTWTTKLIELKWSTCLVT